MWATAVTLCAEPCTQGAADPVGAATEMQTTRLLGGWASTRQATVLTPQS